MMTLTILRFRAIESQRHKIVTTFPSSSSICWIAVKSFLVLVRRTESMRNLLSLRIEEIAVRMCPADDAAGVVKRYLLAALVEEPYACGLVVTHSIRGFVCRKQRQGLKKQRL